MKSKLVSALLVLGLPSLAMASDGTAWFFFVDFWSPFWTLVGTLLLALFGWMA